jgi:hypothetical protein
MKGQAFDTFKLLIAAVVAVAILGVLLSIMSGLIIPGAEPPTMIREQLSKATQFPESSFISPTKASFKAGASYSPNSFSDAIGGVGTIEFECSEDLIGVCAFTTEKLRISGDFSAYIGACCKSNTCKVSILMDDEDAPCPGETIE